MARQFPQAAGAPIYGPTVIPPRFYSDFLKKYYRTTVLKSICNTDFDKDITGYGDILNVAQLPDMELFDYNEGMNLPTQQNFYKPDVQLKIDQAKGWRVPMNPVFNRQTMHKDFWSRMAEDGAKKINIAIDRTVLAGFAALVNASNQGATAGVVTQSWDLGTAGAAKTISPDACVPLLLAGEQVLFEQDVVANPDGGSDGVNEDEMYAVVPGWFHSYLMQAKVLQAWISGDAKSPLRTNSVGHVGPVVIHVSNNLPYTAATKTSPILFGVKKATSFALQLQVAETKPAATDFGEIMQALTVWGWNVMIDKAVAVAYVKPGSLTAPAVEG